MTNPAVYACGKARFTFEQASREVKRLRRKKDARLVKYRCPACGAWHVGGLH